MEARKPGDPGPAILWACLLTLGGVAFHAWQRESTPEFRGIGTIWALVMTGAVAVFLLPLSFVAALVASWLYRRGCFPGWIGRRAILACGVLLLATCVVLGLRAGNPRQRLVNRVPAADGVVSDVRVAGFNAFLGRRWLYSFQVKPADAERIAESLGLQESREVDLRKSLEREGYFSGTRFPEAVAIPGPEATRGYFRTFRDGPEDQSVAWITMAVSEQDQRAWLYMGYQN